MRKERNGDDTKDRVLAVAKDLFAAGGYSGTSLAMIAAKSGISDGLILHHFKSKQNLYQKVLEGLALEYSQVFQNIKKDSGDPEELMQTALNAVLEFWSKDSAYNRISLWAYLEDQPGLAENEALLTANLARMVKELQDKGIVNNKVAPFVLLTMTIGPIHFWNRYREQFKSALKLSEELSELDADFQKQFISLIKVLYQS